MSIVTDGWGSYGGVVAFGFGVQLGAPVEQGKERVVSYFPEPMPEGGGGGWRRRLGDRPEWAFPIYEGEPEVAGQLNRWIMRNVQSGPFIKVWSRWRARAEGMDEKRFKAGMRRWMDRAEKQKLDEESPFLFVVGLTMLVGRVAAAAAKGN